MLCLGSKSSHRALLCLSQNCGGLAGRQKHGSELWPKANSRGFLHHSTLLCIIFKKTQDSENLLKSWKNVIINRPQILETCCSFPVMRQHPKIMMRTEGNGGYAANTGSHEFSSLILLSSFPALPFSIFGIPCEESWKLWINYISYSLIRSICFEVDS